MQMRQSLFWDTRVKDIDVRKNAVYIIERTLELGNDREVGQLLRFYGPALIKEVIKNSRSLSAKTKNLWEILLRKK